MPKIAFVWSLRWRSRARLTCSGGDSSVAPCRRTPYVCACEHRVRLSELVPSGEGWSHCRHWGRVHVA
eukprot:3992511-Prymnesium_polylepis.1